MAKLEEIIRNLQELAGKRRRYSNVFRLYQSRGIESVAVAAAGMTIARDHGLGFVDRHGTAFVVSSIELRDSIGSFGFGGHFDETETLATPAVTVHDDFGGPDSAALRKDFAETLIGCGEWQIANIQFLTHLNLLKAGSR
jgi:hypothetical protein